MIMGGVGGGNQWEPKAIHEEGIHESESINEEDVHDQDGTQEEAIEPVTEPQQDQPQTLRRSTRLKNTRVYYNAQAVVHPAHATCSFAQFPIEHQVYVSSLDE